MSSNNKNIIIRLRVDEVTTKTIRSKADSNFNKNTSTYIRCTTLQYNGDVALPPAKFEIAALLTTILRQFKKIGTNVNQTNGEQCILSVICKWIGRGISHRLTTSRRQSQLQNL